MGTQENRDCAVRVRSSSPGIDLSCFAKRRNAPAGQQPPAMLVSSTGWVTVTRKIRTWFQGDPRRPLPLILVMWRAGYAKAQWTFRFELSGPDVFLAHIDTSTSERERESLDGGQLELALTSL